MERIKKWIMRSWLNASGCGMESYALWMRRRIVGK